MCTNENKNKIKHSIRLDNLTKMTFCIKILQNG